MAIINNSYKALETSYNGYRFRSRTEARWAVFMDALEIEYEYEKEGYVLGDAGCYLPDFWLPEQDCWLEIKPGPPTDVEKEKAWALSKHTDKLVFCFNNCAAVKWVSNNRGEGKLKNTGYYFSPDGDWDGCQEFGVCWACEEVCIGHFGGHFVSCDKRYERPTDCFACPTKRKNESALLVSAYETARSARFGT